MDREPPSATVTQALAVASGVDLRISYVSASVSQMAAWCWLWRRLLQERRTTPTASGTNTEAVSGNTNVHIISCRRTAYQGRGDVDDPS
jgi:hypothetical protein